ncbi:hypothetical protein ACFV4F_37075 [Kitasatospora sp. NPDC059722]|uniref:hypothetical protein n=1 Tax=unclassified Kitasatospora TaxID=2633591 RepID=UPI003651B0B1
MKRIVLTTVALLAAVAAWLPPTASARAHDSHTTTAQRGGPTPSAPFTCPPRTRCNDTSWGG